MHQFTAHTSKTLLANSPAAEDIWQRAVPHMALEAGRSYLTDAMLSLAALHLRSQQPDDKALARASHAYAASTLAAYRATLQAGITADNAEALFLTASLIAFQSAAFRIFPHDDDDDDDDDDKNDYHNNSTCKSNNNNSSKSNNNSKSNNSNNNNTSGGDDGKEDAADGSSDGYYALPMAWFHAFQGVKTVVASSWPWIRDSDVVRAIIDTQPSFQLDLNPLGSNSFFRHLLDDLADELATEAADLAAATSQAYSHAVSVLNWAHRTSRPSAALAFPASVSRRFVELVQAKRPRALAILASFFALLKRMDRVWWLGDVARREVMGIVGILDPSSPWPSRLEWPLRIALIDLHPIPVDIWGLECEDGPEADPGSVDSMRNHIELLIMSTAGRPPAASQAKVPAPDWVDAADAAGLTAPPPD